MKDAILNEYNNKYPDEETEKELSEIDKINLEISNEEKKLKELNSLIKKYNKEHLEIVNKAVNGKFADLILEKTLDTYFPKGDERRGDALVLFSTAMVIINKLKRRLSEEE